MELVLDGLATSVNDLVRYKNQKKTSHAVKQSNKLYWILPFEGQPFYLLYPCLIWLNRQTIYTSETEMHNN